VKDLKNPIIIRSDELNENDYGATKTTDILKTKILNIAKVRKISDDIKTGHDTESDVTYYVLDGEGDCFINGEKHHLKKGDCVFYPKGTKYKHLKGLTLLAIASPPFDRKKRVYDE
jgi:mannose-6-phosphate isomerase-like protein (cupin superfamily)